MSARELDHDSEVVQYTKHNKSYHTNNKAQNDKKGVVEEATTMDSVQHLAKSVIFVSRLDILVRCVQLEESHMKRTCVKKTVIIVTVLTQLTQGHTVIPNSTLLYYK